MTEHVKQNFLKTVSDFTLVARYLANYMSDLEELTKFVQMLLIKHSKGLDLSSLKDQLKAIATFETPPEGFTKSSAMAWLLTSHHYFGSNARTTFVSENRCFAFSLDRVDFNQDFVIDGEKLEARLSLPTVQFLDVPDKIPYGAVIQLNPDEELVCKQMLSSISDDIGLIERIRANNDDFDDLPYEIAAYKANLEGECFVESGNPLSKIAETVASNIISRADTIHDWLTDISQRNWSSFDIKQLN